MSFRHNDGSVNIDALRHAARLLVILLDLHDLPEERTSIGLVNIAPLLMALALPYDGAAARATAAAIGAIVTAEAYKTSAELAALRGASPSMIAAREFVLRALRNHRRAAYGDPNDYEGLSVAPAPLALNACPDLALVAAARAGWDQALDMVRKHGLRGLQTTTLSQVPALAVFMESSTQGIAPMPSLTVLQPGENDVYRRIVHPSVGEALARLGYDRTQSAAIIRHISGTRSLAAAPGIVNHETLRALGFTAEALTRLENYLPEADDIRLAFTPWVLDMEFCRAVLKIPESKLMKPRFDMLKHLGFAPEAIAAANLYCYGHDSAKAAPGLAAKHAAVFARGEELSPEARIRMAGAVQGLIAGETGLELPLAAEEPVEKVEKLILMAWRQSIKSLEIDYRMSPAAAESVKKIAGRIGAALQRAQPPALPARKAKPRADSRLAGIKPKASRRGWVRR
jgi:ribonucleoside-diphosphate reductase alpha chain